ncbi:MAG: hypothetical protein R3C28_26115 [Pirellulaceae bacterium]
MAIAIRIYRRVANDKTLSPDKHEVGEFQTRVLARALHFNVQQTMAGRERAEANSDFQFRRAIDLL